MSRTRRKRWRTFVKIVLPSLVAILVVVLCFIGFISYQIIFPKVSAEGDPSGYFLLDFQEIALPGLDSTLWFLQGRSGAPVVFLCHDYASNRLSVLNLASVLHANGYSVGVLPSRGHGKGSSEGTALGLLEGADVAYAVDSVLSRSSVDGKRTGLWGVGLGAHAALRAALLDSRVRALSLDSPYPSVSDFVDYQVSKRLGFQNRLVGGSIGVVSAFYSGRIPLAVFEDLTPASLYEVPVLYLAGEDSPEFLEWTRQLYSATKGPKELVVLPRTRRSLLATPEWEGYDSRVAGFFNEHLPIRVKRAQR